jgi:glycine dehydrogenase subunit 1
MSFTPHTPADIRAMLERIGAKNIDALFDEIPSKIRIDGFSEVPASITEMEAMRLGKERAAKDHYELNFIGAGAYEHHIPAAVWDIASRGEFLTAYTPYQAEASQGTLQLLYEFQTMMANLMAMEVSNASMYEGASSLAEAILMAVRANKQAQSKRVLVPTTLHPYYRKVIKTIVTAQGIELLSVGYDAKTGRMDQQDLEKYAGSDLVALVIPQPNFFGVIDDIDTLTNWAHAQKALAISVVNPIAMALLKPPGQWGANGADIAVGEGQPLGAPLASGGPYFGFMTCKQQFVRQMPGRLIGQTVDVDGKVGYALTLQAREQHIRRAKATSNICTNQGLLVTAATIYMSLLGATGLRRMAAQAHANTKALSDQLTAIKGVSQVFHGPFFQEVVLKFDRPVKSVLAELSQQDILGGFAMTADYPELGECLLVCATETKTEKDLELYVQRLRAVVEVKK